MPHEYRKNLKNSPFNKSEKQILFENKELYNTYLNYKSKINDSLARDVLDSFRLKEYDIDKAVFVMKMNGQYGANWQWGSTVEKPLSFDSIELFFEFDQKFINRFLENNKFTSDSIKIDL